MLRVGQFSAVWAAAFLIALAGSSQLWAQSAPDPGVLLEEQRRSTPPPVRPRATPSLVAPFQGFSAVSGLEPQEAELLRRIETRYLGQSVTPRQVLDQVALELERQGVTVVLETDSERRVQAVKPTLSAVDINDKRDRRRFDPRELLSYRLTIPARLNRLALERNATLLNETPGVVANYQMLPGEQPGQTRLLATIESGQPFDVLVLLDNAGNKFVGRSQLTVAAGLNDRFGRGERLALYALKAEEGEYLQGIAEALLHPSGLRGGVNVSRFTYSYRATSGELVLPFSGDARSRGVQLSLPLTRSEWERSNVSLSWDQKRNAGRVNAQPLSDWAVDTLTVGFQRERSVSGGLTLSYAGYAVWGNASQRDEQIAARDEPFLDQSGGFGKFNLQAALTHVLNDDNLTVGLALVGQLASKNLPSSEKLQIGGPSLMRARSPQLVGGDQAIHVEFRVDRPVGQLFRAGAFWEQAWLKANVDRVTTAAYQANTADNVSLADAGLRVVATPGATSIELTVAYPVLGTARFMNGSPIESRSGWVSYLRGSYRFSP